MALPRAMHPARRPGGPRRLVRAGGAVAAACILVVGPGSALAEGRAHAHFYRQTNLVSDIPGKARTTDPKLVNPWGLAAGPDTPVWVADNGTDAATIYTGTSHGGPSTRVPLVVDIPGGAPTGQVFNPTSDFVVRSGNASGPAVFIFSSETGRITGWNPDVPPPSPSTSAQTGATVSGAVYKGLAIAKTSEGSRLFAANFSQGTVDVFDGHFKLLNQPKAFVDHRIPKGYAPFNVQELDGRLYVTYAKQDATKEDDVPGAGHGFVDVFTTRGKLLARLVSRGPLDSPWGLVLTPEGFGKFGGDLLVGNFGNGRINAFNPKSGAFQGQLRNRQGQPIDIDGLWALRFGNGVAGTRRTLLFTAGIDAEAHGLFGSIQATGAKR